MISGLSHQIPFMKHLMVFLRTRKAFLLDVFMGHDGSLLTNEEHMKFAADWLASAQDATCDGGVSGLYSVRTGWDLSYPETTGYIIPTLLNYSRLTKQNIWRDRAMRMADWLLSIQLSEGAFPLRTDLKTPAVFDTGQIIFGMIGAFRETREAKYFDSAQRAVKWLISFQEPTGAWLRHSYAGTSHPYYTRVAWALLEIYQEENDNKLLMAAKKNLSWALSQQLESGWFQHNSFSVDEYPSLHTIAYAAQGLLQAGEILKDPQYIRAATKVADTLLLKQNKDGSLPGAYDQDWRPKVRWSCLTGNAQMSAIWLKLFLSSGNVPYFEAAKKANSFLKGVQNLHANDDGIKGGIKGSYPIGGSYMPYSYPNWAAKFFLDALLLEDRAAAFQGASSSGVENQREFAG
jgi:uncharacterized protein YyaL (SSP411 family)